MIRRKRLKGAADEAVSGARPDLLDRNGDILATDVKTMSVFAEPNRIIDKDEAVELITAVLPDVDARELRERLGSRKGFVWVKRQITPKEQAEIFHLGLPGVGFVPENKRVYPNGPIGAHVIGFVDKDNVGIAGMEKYLDEQSLTDPHVPGFAVDPESLKPVRLSLDLKVTHALRDELLDGMERFRAKAGAPAWWWTSIPARCSRSNPCPTSIPTIRATCTIRPRSTASTSASTRWARPSRRSRSRWRSTQARSNSARGSMRAIPCATAASRSTISMRPTAS